MSGEPTHKVETQARTVRLHVRVAADLKEMIRQASLKEGVSMTAFVLGHANEAAQRVIEREPRTELGEDASLQVARALKRPPRAVPALIDLFRE